MQVLRKEGSLFAAPMAGLIGDDSEWADCDDALDIKWGLVGVDIGIEPDGGCSECEECELSCGDRKSHDDHHQYAGGT